VSSLEKPDDFPHQDLITHTCVISFILDETSKIIDGNDQFYEILDLKATDKDSKLFKSYLDKEEQWSHFLSKLKEDNCTSTETIKLYKPNGRPVYLKSNFGVKEGKVYVVSIDVTNDILNSDLLKQVNHLAKLGGWTYNPEADVAEWTNTVYEILDIDEKFDLDRDTIIEYIHPSYIDSFNEVVSLLYLDNKPYNIALKIRTEKNEEKWVRVTAHPEIRNDEVVFVYGTLQDITEQKKQAIHLEETKTNMELALKAMNSGYFTHDLVKNEIVYSSSFKEKMNLPAALDDEQFLAYIHPEDKEEAFLQHKREIETDSVYYVNAYRFKSHESNAYKHFEVHGFKVFDSKGVPVKLVGNLIEVEDKYRLTHMQDKHRYYIKTLLDNAFVRSIMLDKHWNILGMDADTLRIFKDRLDYNPVIKNRITLYDRWACKIIEG